MARHGLPESSPLSVLLAHQTLEAEETVKVHLSQLKKDEAAVQEARRALEKEKSVYIRELRRIQHEDRSRFCRHPVLHGRYLLIRYVHQPFILTTWRTLGAASSGLDQWTCGSG
jgi:hypothetical protein